MQDSRKFATGIGFLAVLMWSLLATLTAASGTMPPFQLTAVTFGIGGLVGAGWLAVQGRLGDLRQPWPVWLHGVGGLFGYHFFYFTALRRSPPVEAGLINYLWPLLIVLFSAALPGERLRWYHVLGALCGLAGTVLVVGGGPAGISIRGEFALGYAAAALAAVIWALYSVASRRFPHVPSGAVAGFCLGTSLLSALCHIASETTVWPAGPGQWAAVIGLGLMPVGAAFYVWDYGLKRGDIQVIGASAYAAPILSTGLLILAGYGTLTGNVLIAALLVAGGAALASAGMLFRRRKPG